MLSFTFFLIENSTGVILLLNELSQFFDFFVVVFFFLYAFFQILSFYIQTSIMASSLTPFLDNHIPIPAPTKNDTKLVIRTVKKTSFVE